MHWALEELLVVTSPSVLQLCQLEGRDLRWHSSAPMGQVVIRSMRTGRVHVHGVSDGLFEILLRFEDGPRRRLLRFADGRALNPDGARAMLREIAAVAGVDDQLALQGLRRFGAELDRRLADNFGMTVEELYRYKRAAAADTLPLDDPPPPLGEFAKNYLKAVDERVKYALRDP